MAVRLKSLATLEATAASPDGPRRLGRGKPVALLAYLAAAPSRRASRERLATLLWSEGSSDQARQNLRQAIWYLRRRLGPFIEGSDDFVELVGEVDCDRDRFLAAVRDGRLKDAVAAYGGPFIPDFAAPGAAEFEEWVDIERRRLRALFIGCVDTLARQALGDGQFATAASLARRVRDEAPLEQLSWRLLLEALVASRDTVGALAEVEHLEATLSANDLELDESTRSAVRAARWLATSNAAGSLSGAQQHMQRHSPPRGSAEIAPGEPQSLAPELIGREAEFRALLGRWDAAREGGGGAVLVAGVAGLGKSRLLTDFHARLRAGRARALLIRANPGDRAIGSGFVAAVAEALGQRPGAAAVSAECAAVLVALAPALSSSFPQAIPDRSSGEDALRRRVGALLDLLRAVSDENALALLIDDIHWTDDESRRVLDAVAARLDGGRVLLVLTARPPIEALGGFATLDRIELPRLDLPRVAEFLTRLGELPETAWATALPAQLHAATRGLPLTVLEALQRLMESGSLRLRDGQWSSDAPDRIAELLREGMVLEARVRSLGAGARELLLLLETIGRPIAAEAVSGAADNAAPEALAELEHRGFIVRRRKGADGGDLVHVAHDEIGAAASAVATVGERAAAHRAAAVILAGLPETEQVLTLATRHALVARSPEVERPLVRPLIRRFLRRRRLEGDGRAARAIVRDLVGEADWMRAGPELMRAVPWVERPAAWTRRAMAVGALLAVAVGGAQALRTERAPDLEVYVTTLDSAPRLVRFTLHDLEQWSPGSALEGEVVDTSLLPFPIENDHRRVGWSLPDGSAAFGYAFAGDSGGDEVFVTRPGLGITFPVPYEGDDSPGTPSPDGRYLSLSTARFHPETDWMAIAIVDLRTGELRRVSHSNDYDNAPFWSPDGTRLAFRRRYHTEVRPNTACVINVDGTGERCVWPKLTDNVDPLGWLDDQRVAVLTEDLVLMALDLASGEVTPIQRGVAMGNLLSDRRVLQCRCDLTGDGDEDLHLSRIDRPGAPRRLELDGRPVRGRVIHSWARPRRRAYIESIGLFLPETPIPVDVPFHLRPYGVDSAGQRLEAHGVRAWSLDDSVASVDDRMVLQPRRTGVARVVITLGGWRTDTVEVRIGPSTARVSLSEPWTDDWTTRWRAFGDPMPRLGGTRTRPTLMTNGDGSYASGIYLREPLEASQGLGLEVRVRVPITVAQWQHLEVRLFEGAQFDRLKGWDHRSGTGPFPAATACNVTMGGEGGGALLRMSVTVGSRVVGSPRTPPGLFDGRWHTVRLQLFPDGRCAIAVDSVPLFRAVRGRTVTPPLMLQLSGHMVKTRIEVGPLEIWQGVRGGVDWQSLDLQDPR